MGVIISTMCICFGTLIYGLVESIKTKDKRGKSAAVIGILVVLFVGGLCILFDLGLDKMIKFVFDYW